MTTPVQGRWWAPTEPGIGPDEFDLELLEPGGDPSADLGQAFLALHRVGAAACEAVATQPLADESALAFALANARKMVAPEASTIVSKAVGDDVNYANLLLRDMLDDAEAAALSLWRSCIAKSVPAPIAAQRVGMIYGLPAGALYRFQKAATDPKTSPVALVDLADRALFEHLAQVVKAEAVDRKVEVSKMSAQEWNRTEEGAKHPKDTANGRFARLANRSTPTVAGMDVNAWLAQQMSTPAPPEVATPAAAPPKLARPQRPQRPKRQQRPQGGAQAAASAKVRGSVSGARSGTISALVEAGKLQALLDAQHDDRPPNPTLDVTRNLSRTQRKPGDVTQPFAEQDMTLQFIPHQLAYVLPTDEAMAFERAAPRGELGAIFRAGRLTEYAGDPEMFREDEYDDGFRNLGEQHLRNVRTTIEVIRQDQDFKGQPPKQVRYLDSAAVDWHDPTSLLEEKVRFLADLGLSEAQIRSEVKHVDHAINIDDRTQVALVYSPPPADRTRLAHRPKVEVTEIVVLDEELMGHREGYGRHETWIPERNAGLTFVSGALGGVGPARFWDNEMQAFRTVRPVRVTDEVDDVAKAMTPEQFRQAEEQGLEGRDANGLFIGHILRQLEEQGMTAAPVARPQRPTRPRRPTRAARPGGQASAQASGRVSTTTGGRVAGRVSGKPTRDELRMEITDLPGLTMGDYTVLPTGMHLPFGFARKRVDAPFRNEVRRYEIEDERQAENRILGVHMGAHTAHRSRGEEELHTYRGITPDDLEEIAAHLHREMEDDPEFTIARYHFTMTDEETATLVIHRNNYPIGPRDVIRWPPGVSTSRYGELEPAERTRVQSIRSIKRLLEGGFASAEHAPNGEDRDYIVNPWVRVWEASD